MAQYTKEQMFTKLSNADKAGDVEAAKFFASEIRKMDSGGAQPSQEKVSDLATQARIAQLKGLGEWNDNRQREVGAKYRQDNNQNAELSNYSDEQIGERLILAQGAPAVATMLLPGGMIGKGLLKATAAGGALGAVEESAQQFLEKQLLGTEYDGEKVGKEAVTGALTGAAVNAIPSMLRPLAHAALAGKKKAGMAIADLMMRGDKIEGANAGLVQKTFDLIGAPTPDLSTVTNNAGLRIFDQLLKGLYFRGNKSKKAHDEYLGWIDDKVIKDGLSALDGKKLKGVLSKNAGGIGRSENAVLDMGLFLTGGPLANAAKNATAEASAQFAPTLANKILKGLSLNKSNYGKAVSSNLEKSAKISVGEAKLRRAQLRGDTSLDGKTAYRVGSESKRIQILNKTKQSNKAIPMTIALQELVLSLFGE